MGIVTFSVWIVTGGGLATVIILGDICYDPDTLLRNNTDNTQAEGTEYLYLNNICSYLPL